MLKRLAFFLGMLLFSPDTGIISGGSAKADTLAPAVPIDDDRIKAILELEKASPDQIEEFCNRIISGKAELEILLKAIPGILRAADEKEISSSERLRIRDCIKKVVFHTNLERTTESFLYNTIKALSSGS